MCYNTQTVVKYWSNPYLKYIMNYIIKFPTPDEDPEIPEEEGIELAITENSRLTFGKHGPKRRRAGKKLCECPKDYLEWMTENLKDTDFHEWAIAAEKYLEKVQTEDAPIQNLNDAADDFLRSHGIDPKKL